jgi:tetratricopeptide (TPR) repeat protein
MQLAGHMNVFTKIIFLILLSCFATVAQVTESEKTTKLRLAQQFEQASEWERAASLYEDLYKLEPTNYIFMDGLQRSYTQLKEYDKAIHVIRNWLVFQPRDVNMKTIVGGLYYDSGDEIAADSIWKSVIATDPNNIQIYRIVANEMMEHRLYEMCIRTYLNGRAVSKNDALFADELGSLFSALQQYTSATEEYILMIRTTPDQLPFVQSRLSAYISKPEGLKSAVQVVSEAVKNAPRNIALHRLLAWLFLEERNFKNALQEYRVIDELANAMGNELYSYAQRLHQEHAPKTAVEAYKEILDLKKNPALLPYARLGYARALEELCYVTATSQKQIPATPLSVDADSQATYQNVLRLYESILAERFNTDLIGQALFRIGMIKLEKTFDLDGALSAFSKMKELPQLSNVSYDALIKIGEVQIARNDLPSAQKEYERLSKVTLVVYQDQATFKLAELEYFKASFDSSLSLLKRFNTNLNTDLANDALQLQYFIQENQTSTPQALKAFAYADLLIRQRKYSEALTRFQSIIQQFPNAQLIDDALMKTGELHLILDKPMDAINDFVFITDSLQMSIHKDRAQFRIAEIFDSVLNNSNQAIEAYQKLLAKYPNSLYAEEARKRVRILRGDNL